MVHVRSGVTTLFICRSGASQCEVVCTFKVTLKVILKGGFRVILVGLSV